MTKAELIASGKSGFYSPAHDAYFFDGETPPPLPSPLPSPEIDVVAESKKSKKD